MTFSTFFQNYFRLECRLFRKQCYYFQGLRNFKFLPKSPVWIWKPYLGPLLNPSTSKGNQKSCFSCLMHLVSFFFSRNNTKSIQEKENYLNYRTTFTFYNVSLLIFATLVQNYLKLRHDRWNCLYRQTLGY